MADERFAPLTRRRFLGLMGSVASLGLAVACGLGFKLSEYQTPTSRSVQDAVAQIGPAIQVLIAQTETTIESAAMSYRSR